MVLWDPGCSRIASFFPLDVLFLSFYCFIFLLQKQNTFILESLETTDRHKEETKITYCHH